MQGNRRRDTKPELAVRHAAHALGLRYQVDARPLAGLNRRADLVFTRAKVAVFVDGCYWHGCPEHATTPKANAAYWGPKISRNRSRDAETDQRLRDAGWVPLRIWEHEDASEAAQRIANLVRERRGTFGRRSRFPLQVTRGSRSSPQADRTIASRIGVREPDTGVAGLSVPERPHRDLRY